ncbi:MAG: DUF350 domain-containing protein [Leptospiraceae bacterium]|nr:DUF350 domain-containing protein [Leptospiraceae bacterium]
MDKQIAHQIVNMNDIINVLIFSVIGIIVLSISFYVFDKMTPNELWDEIVEKQNVALAITAGAMVLAIAQIIAAAIKG